MQLESRDTQYRASVRKKELEYGKLQDSLRRASQKDTRGGKNFHRGMELNFELSPGEATTEGGREPLGGVLNEKALKKVAALEKENSTLRNMVVDLQVGFVKMSCCARLVREGGRSGMLFRGAGFIIGNWRARG